MWNVSNKKISKEEKDLICLEQIKRSTLFLRGGMCTKQIDSANLQVNIKCANIM